MWKKKFKTDLITSFILLLLSYLPRLPRKIGQIHVNIQNHVTPEWIIFFLWNGGCGGSIQTALLPIRKTPLFKLKVAEH